MQPPVLDTPQRALLCTCSTFRKGRRSLCPLNRPPVAGAPGIGRGGFAQAVHCTGESQDVPPTGYSLSRLWQRSVDFDGRRALVLCSPACACVVFPSTCCCGSLTSRECVLSVLFFLGSGALSVVVLATARLLPVCGILVMCFIFLLIIPVCGINTWYCATCSAISNTGKKRGLSYRVV